MTSTEMKLVKFKKIVGDILLEAPYKYYSSKEEHPLRLLFGSECNNEFSTIILNNTFNNQSFFNAGAKDIEELIKKCVDVFLGKQIVFFSLIILAIDDDFYNERLSILTDFAYLIKFDEDMMSDWIYAVKSILSAEIINLTKMKTEEGKEFFSYLSNAKFEED